MKLTTILLIAVTMHVAAAGNAQKVTLNVKNVPLKTVFVELNKQTGYNFLYSDEALAGTEKVTIKVKDASIEEVLDLALRNQPLEFSMLDNTIVVKPKQSSEFQSEVISLPPPIDVKGRIVNENGEPVIATVMVKGTKIGTTTDSNGEFQLTGINEDAVLVISGVSIEPLEIAVAKNPGLKSGRGLTIAAKTEVTTLNEVIINKGYYSEKQRLSVSNVGQVTAKDIEKQPVNNPLLALQGRVPGLFITQANGLAGGGVKVRIQGQNSIGSGNDPLYVIDGVPYVSQMPLTNTGGAYSMLGSSGGSASSGSGNPFSYINPSDIESIDILKDADATAIYGSRAANGAILITTKKGKTGPTKVGIDIQKGWGEVTSKLDLLNTRQYLDMRYEAISNDGLLITSAANVDLRLWDTTSYTDWQRSLIGGTAQYTNINANVSGGTSNIQYLVGGTYHRETSVFPGDFADQKGSLHFNLNSVSANQKFRMQLISNYLVDNNNLPGIDLTTSAIQMAPNAPALYKSDGTLNWAPNAAGTSSWTNPLAYTNTPYQNKARNLISNAILSYRILTGLDIKSSFGYTNLQTDEYMPSYLTSVAPETIPFASRIATYTSSDVNSWIIEPQLTYIRTLGKGKLDVLLGTTIQQINTNGQSLTGTGYNSDGVLKDIRSAASIKVNSSVASMYKYNALFGRATYNLQDKYILNLNVRRDGSSRFGSQSQFHNFGSIGAAWIFSQERFLQKSMSFLSFGKLRGSYGTTGNDQIGDYKFMNLYNPINANVPFQGATGLRPIGLQNPYLQWEETKKLQIGLDLGFLNDRILLTTNYVHNRSSNQLLDYTLPIITGFTGITENFPATVQNTAWEFLLNTSNVKSENFNWNSSFNLTIPKNKLVAFPKLATSSYASALIIGQPITIVKVYHFLGVDPATGKYLIDSKTDPFNPAYPDDATVLINTSPKFYGGFQNSFNYKGIQLDLLFQFVKQIGSNYFIGSALPPGRVGLNQPVSVLNRWQKPGDVTTIQRYNSNLSIYTQYTNAQFSDISYSDASYVRLKNLSLSYQFPDRWLKKMSIQNFRVYVHGQNLLTITKFKGMDPETGTGGLPPLRMITLGLQIGL